MNLNQNITENANHIDAISKEYLMVNKQKINQSCIITNSDLKVDLALTNINDLSTQHINKLLESQPEIVLFGSGVQHTFPDVELLTPIAKANIGFEVMNNQSVARTFNVLIAEERKVACLVILD